MEIKSNYEKCVILNDLQRQLEYYEVWKDKYIMRVWDVWYDGHYLGSIHNMNHSHKIYSVHSGACTASEICGNFMEALAFFVEYLVEYIELEESNVSLVEPIEEKPEETIFKSIVNFFIK